jgi:hypothetical protein
LVASCAGALNVIAGRKSFHIAPVVIISISPMFPWRSHPRLADRFHPQYPDHLQVVIHEGGPRLSKAVPELVWVEITHIEDENVFAGKILNQPRNLSSLRSGDEIKFVVPHIGKYPLLTTQKYLNERSQWKIHGCNKCGLTELFDAPSDLRQVIFPHMAADAEIEMFTSFCGFCGGIQGIEHLTA